jgi:AraC-like DNA-binding protein
VPHICTTTAVRGRDVTVVRATCDGYDAPRARDEHVPEAHLWLVTEGAFVLRDRAGTRTLDPTTAVVLAPRAPFTVRHPAGPDVCLSLRGPIVDELATGGSRELHPAAPPYARLVAAVAACRHGEGDALVVAEALVELVDHAAPPARAMTAAHRMLAEALAHELRIGIAAQTSLRELAEATGASVFHASRVFRAATGSTLHGYRRELRLRHALAMILDGDAPLAEIAAATGFASQSHLTNLFRARFGQTPGRVRARRSL